MVDSKLEFKRGDLVVIIGTGKVKPRNGEVYGSSLQGPKGEMVTVLAAGEWRTELFPASRLKLADAPPVVKRSTKAGKRKAAAAAVAMAAIANV